MIARTARNAAALVAMSMAGGTTMAQEITVNDYPTIARADYVFACMASNGQTRTALEQCSCSIDVIASIIPYDSYVEAETVMSMALAGGERMAMFRTDNTMQLLVAELKRAQAEADIRCF